MPGDNFQNSFEKHDGETDSRWKTSLGILIICGMIDGIILGAANGVLCHYIIGVVGSPFAAVLYGAAFGGGAAALIVLLRRAIWGPEIGMEIGTMLGLLYGVAPGLLIFAQAGFANRAIGPKAFVGLLMAASMLGFILGGALDRITENFVRWLQANQDEDATTEPPSK